MIDAVDVVAVDVIVLLMMMVLVVIAVVVVLDTSRGITSHRRSSAALSVCRVARAKRGRGDSSALCVYVGRIADRNYGLAQCTTGYGPWIPLIADG